MISVYSSSYHNMVIARCFLIRIIVNGSSFLGLFVTEFCQLCIRHRWTGRYEAHLWDKSTWNQNQNKKGKQGLGCWTEVRFKVFCDDAIAYAFCFCAVHELIGRKFVFGVMAVYLGELTMQCSLVLFSVLLFIEFFAALLSLVMWRCLLLMGFLQGHMMMRKQRLERMTLLLWNIGVLGLSLTSQ